MIQAILPRIVQLGDTCALFIEECLQCFKVLKMILRQILGYPWQGHD
ncbi:unnamed protein product [Brassica oleracea]